MATAKFHIVGNSSMWFRTRVQDEIHASGLEGSALDAGDKNIAVIIEGEKQIIEELYDRLRGSAPDEVGFTAISFGDYAASTKTARNLMITNSMETILELLKEIEKNTRKINQKIDRALVASGEGEYTPAYETEEETPEEETMEETPEEAAAEEETKEEKQEEATSAFADMFG